MTEEYELCLLLKSMKKPLLGFLSLIFSLTAASAQYNETTVIPSSQPGGKPTTVIQNMAGICAVARKDKDTGKVIIMEVLPDGAAAKAGLLIKDQIDKVDGQSLEGMDLIPIVALLRGDPGTQVKLTITREGQAAPFDVTVTRELVRLKEVVPPK